MEKLSKYICDKIWNLCNEMIDGEVSDDLLYRYGISNDYLEVCRDSSHCSCKKLRNRLFCHIAYVSGYYACRNDRDNLSAFADFIDDKLMNTTSPENREILYLPKMLFGVRKILDHINSFSEVDNIEFDGHERVSSLQVSKTTSAFNVSYRRWPNDSVALEDTSIGIHVKFGSESFFVPPEGRHVNKHQIIFTDKDVISLSIDSFQTCSLNDETSYFFRYITEVDKIPFIQGVYDCMLMDIDGMDISVMDTLVDTHALYLYFVANNDKNYLIIDYEKALPVLQMQELCFSVIVALGMLTCHVHLNDCWLAAYDTSDRKSETGLFFRKLSPSFKCNYEIFSTNVYNRLVPVAMRIDPINGEKRAIKIIDDFLLANAIPPFCRDVFGRIIENMNKFEKLQRGIYILLLGSQYSLEIQAAAYCVALEAIASLHDDITGKKESRLISDSARWDDVRNHFMHTAKELYDCGAINDEEKINIEKKIDGINTNFNAEKLKALLEHYHYPLSRFDKLTLSLRNPLLHGSIRFKKLKGDTADNLLQLSMNLHKLCCATALLMAGYSGYIVNNRNLHGFPKSGTAFIRIGNPF